VGAPEVWVTHGRDDALVHTLGLRGVRARALHLVGLGEEDEEAVAAPPAMASDAAPGPA